METAGVSFDRAIYKLSSVNEKGTTINYSISLFNEVVNDYLFTDVVRIQLDNGYHDRSRYFDYWLYFRNTSNWKKCRKTGLAKTGITNVLEGNISRPLNLSIKDKKGNNLETPQHLVILQKNDKFDTIIIDIFKDFYLPDKTKLSYFIKDHITKHYYNL